MHSSPRLLWDPAARACRHLACTLWKTTHSPGSRLHPTHPRYPISSHSSRGRAELQAAPTHPMRRGAGKKGPAPGAKAPRRHRGGDSDDSDFDGSDAAPGNTSSSSGSEGEGSDWSGSEDGVVAPKGPRAPTAPPKLARKPGAVTTKKGTTDAGAAPAAAVDRPRGEAGQRAGGLAGD